MKNYNNSKYSMLIKISALCFFCGYSQAEVSAVTTKTCDGESNSAAIAIITAPLCVNRPSTALVGSSVTQAYEYDALGRLIKVSINGAVKGDYQYDKAGNRQAVTQQQ